MSALLGIIADDLSGANDAGLQFGKRGLATIVLFDLPDVDLPSTDAPSIDSPRSNTLEVESPFLAEADVVVIDTDSRQVDARAAARSTGAAVAALRRLGVTTLYKKIDSTLRGHLGAEIDSLLSVLTTDQSAISGQPGIGGRPAVIVAPAFPKLGRTVTAGVLSINGVPLHATDIARDPVWPTASSVVLAAIRRESTRRAAEIGLDVVRLGSGALAVDVRNARRAGAEVIVIDAESTADLAAIARVVAESAGSLVGVGSAGLAEELPAALGLESKQPRTSEGDARDSSEPPAPAAGPVIVVVGSINTVSRAQLRTLTLRSGWPAVGLGVAELLAGGAAADAEIERRAEELASYRSGGVTLSLEADAGVPALLGRARATGEDPGVLAKRLATALGETIHLAFERGCRPRGLVLTGGDTAKAVCRALGASGVIVEQEVLPGIPVGQLVGGAASGQRIVTKAGGFGATDALRLAAEYLLGEGDS